MLSAAKHRVVSVCLLPYGRGSDWRNPTRNSKAHAVPVRSLRRWWRHAVFPMSIGLMFTGFGCHGGASYTIVSLEMKRISASEKLTVPIKAGECYHWVNDAGRLCVAMRMNDSSILGAMFSKKSVASFVLGDPPAATGRNYRATRSTARFHNDAGYGHTRAASLGGIVGVWNYDKPVVSGRFRLNTIQQSYSVLTGWTGKKRVLYVGSFNAVRDRRAGEAILLETERDGMARRLPAGRPRRIQGPFPTKRQRTKKQLSSPNVSR